MLVKKDVEVKAETETKKEVAKTEYISGACFTKEGDKCIFNKLGTNKSLVIPGEMVNDNNAILWFDRAQAL